MMKEITVPLRHSKRHDWRVKRERPTHGWRFFVLFGCVALCSGCSSPMLTRYPVMSTGHPRSEGLAYQQQDPFPSPDIGPDSGARPPDFFRPRTEARQAAEQRLFQGSPAVSPATSPFAPSGNPRGGLNRPAAVY